MFVITIVVGENESQSYHQGLTQEQALSILKRVVADYEHDLAEAPHEHAHDHDEAPAE